METSALSCLINIFVEPKKALIDIKGHARWLWYPFLIMMLVTTAFGVWYYMTVDIGWMADQILSTMSAKMDADKLEQVRHSFTRGRFLFGAIIGGTVVIGLIYVIQALYLFLVSKVAGYEVQEFGKWFSFTAWTSFPAVLAPVAQTVSYLFSPNKQVSLYQLDVTSLNTLFFHLPMQSHWFTTVYSLRLTLFWTLGLMVYGFSIWTRKSLPKSAVVVLAPYVIIYGLIVIIKLT
jgi:hypothetical protein